MDNQNKIPENLSSQTSQDYIPYPKALKILSERLNAKPEEIAAWVWEGQNDWGLPAYLNANELEPPPRFYFNYYIGDDYLSAIMACWFLSNDIANFHPAERYISGKALIERWSLQPGIRVEAFIKAKIAESRLLDMHPVMGITQWSEGKNFPPKEIALFVISHVEEVERVDFGIEQISRSKEQKFSPMIGSQQWRSQNAQAAANARHDKAGGSRDKQRQIREIWKTGKYDNRDLCAEEECAALRMSFSAARNALKNIPSK